MNDPANLGGERGESFSSPAVPTAPPQYPPETRSAGSTSPASAQPNKNQGPRPNGEASAVSSGQSRVQPSPELAASFPALDAALRYLGSDELPTDRTRNRNAHCVLSAIEPGEPEPRSALGRHERKCVICHHPDREAIEEEFLNWHSPFKTAIHHNVAARTLYRHALAVGLTRRRRGNMRAVLDRLLDRADGATVTGDSIIRALRAYTCLADDQHWVEPPARVIYSSESRPRNAKNTRPSQRKTLRGHRKPRTAHRASRTSRSNRHSGD
jgi:hypothetical protein